MIKAILIEKETVDGIKKYAVVFNVPRSWRYNRMFSTHYEIDKPSKYYMRVDSDGFPQFEGLSPKAKAVPFWTTDLTIAEKLLKDSEAYLVEAEVLTAGYQ